MLLYCSRYKTSRLFIRWKTSNLSNVTSNSTATSLLAGTNEPPKTNEQVRRPVKGWAHPGWNGPPGQTLRPRYTCLTLATQTGTGLWNCVGYLLCHCNKHRDHQEQRIGTAVSTPSSYIELSVLKNISLTSERSQLFYRATLHRTEFGGEEGFVPSSNG